MSVRDDIAETLTIDDVTRGSGNSVIYSGRFSCLTASATTYISIEATQVPEDGTALGIGSDNVTCPPTPGTLAHWQIMVNSITPFGSGVIIGNVYALHLDSLSGDDNENCDDLEGEEEVQNQDDPDDK